MFDVIVINARAGVRGEEGLAAVKPLRPLAARRRRRLCVVVSFIKTWREDNIFSLLVDAWALRTLHSFLRYDNRDFGVHGAKFYGIFRALRV